MQVMRAVGFEHFLVLPVRDASVFALLEGGLIETAQTQGQTVGVRSEAQGAPGSKHYNELMVLVAEDNDINALLAETMLRKVGCRFERVRDGAKAIAAVRETLAPTRTPYDLVLMDLSMPEMDGVEATRAIRGLCRDADVVCPRIVAVTANAFADDRANALRQGLDDYLTKPFEKEQLLKVLDDCLNTRADKLAQSA